MSFYFSTGTTSIERILRLAYGSFSIGTSFIDSLGTSDIRAHIQDGERYILGMLEDTISSIPSPSPNSLSFASDYLSAYLVYSNAFSANKPGEVSDVVKSWREMAEKAIEMYKKGYSAGVGGDTSNVAGKISFTPIFDQRGVDGIGNGILEDSKDIKTSRYK